MDSSFWLLAIITATLSSLIYYFKGINSKYPRGPTGIPFFGSFFSLGGGPHLKFSEWARQYGPIFSVKIGNVRAVVLNDSKSIREAFKEEAFSGRPDNKFFMELAGGKTGVVFSDGHTWTEQRRFALRGLRDFGVGKNTMESIITEEVDEFMEFLGNETGHPISLNRKFSLAILNSIWMITCGKRYKQDDPELKALFDTVTSSFNSFVKSGYLVFIDQLATLAPELSGWNSFVKNVGLVASIMQNEMKEHEKTFIPRSPPRDFLDIYLANIKSTTDPKSSFFKEEGYKQLHGVLIDFFGAGSETTAATLTWAMLYLTINPKVQKKMQEELDREIGKNRRPTLADKPRLPYTEAVMQEVLRMSSIVPTGVFHNTMSNVTFQGFEIPKDTYIIANLHGVHHDPSVWSEPDSFRPERFLTPDGKVIPKPENLLAFSAGKRVCIGETLARDEFFLFLSSIFQRFDVSADRPVSQYSTEPEFGFLLHPKKFNVILKDRLQ